MLTPALTCEATSTWITRFKHLSEWAVEIRTTSHASPMLPKQATKRSLTRIHFQAGGGPTLSMS